MLALLIDNDFREPILKGLLTREPRIDLLRLRDVGLRHAPDPDVLQWAADRGRVVVTHDVNDGWLCVRPRVAPRTNAWRDRGGTRHARRASDRGVTSRDRLPRN